MNKFGGKWTEKKISIFLKYIRAYLVIMSKHPNFRLLYFDGFAGSGTIISNREVSLAQGELDFELEVEMDADVEIYEQIQGVATRVMSINEPRGFDEYVFVEKKQANADRLREVLQAQFGSHEFTVTPGDCNEELLALATFLRKPENRMVRTVAFLDPYGMQLKWEALEALRGLQMDVWILVPTGIGVGRLLRNDNPGKIKPAWMSRLKEFLGMEEDDILNHFYRREETGSLFDNTPTFQKNSRPTEQVAQLYCQRIKAAGLFKFVAEPKALKNSINSTMYHFVLCTNNKTAVKIANDIKG